VFVQFCVGIGVGQIHEFDQRIQHEIYLLLNHIFVQFSHMGKAIHEYQYNFGNDDVFCN